MKASSLYSSSGLYLLKTRLFNSTDIEENAIAIAARTGCKRPKDARGIISVL